MRQFASLCQDCSCSTRRTDLPIDVSKSLSLTLLVQFFKDYCRQQILIKTDLTSMTFQSLYQANLNGLKQQLYSSILAVYNVTFPCGIHESCVTIVDFGLCSAVWQH